MNYDEFEYVILNQEKTPIHKFKDGGKSWDEVKEYDNIGVLIKEPYIVLDFDSASDAQIALTMIRHSGVKCSVMKTTRGIHCWFKSSEPRKNTVKARTATDLHVDIRSWGRAGYTKIKDAGVMREWLIENDDLDELPAFFRIIGYTGKSFNFKGMKSGDGRNQALFNYVLFLQEKGFTKDEVKQTIQLINDCVFAEKLNSREIKTILRDEAFKSDEEVAKLREEHGDIKEKFDHKLLATELMMTERIITVDGVMYLYGNGFYQPEEIGIQRKMIEHVPNIRTHQRNEVQKYLEIMTNVKRSDIKQDVYTVNVINGRLDIRTGKLTEHTPDAIDFERLPVYYDKDAHCDDVDRLLNKVFCNDKDCFQLFTEVLADCLLHENLYQSAFIFVGDGSNGKSTLLHMIHNFIGERNSCTLALEDFSSKFKIAELANKLVNIGDDVENKAIKNSGLMKKLFSGNSVTVEKKYGQPFDLKSYATQIFSCNEIPKNDDQSFGAYRRWVIVPFDARFRPSDADFDPHIGEKVATEQAKSYLLNLAIKGYKSLSKRGSFIEPERVKRRKEQYKVDNNSVLEWIEDKSITIDDLMKEPRNGIYDLYRAWCQASYIERPMSNKSFYKIIMEKFDLEWKQKSDGKRYFVENINIDI